MNKNEEEILKKYDNLKPCLEQFGKKVKLILNDIISQFFLDQNSTKIKLEYRIKDRYSFLTKALYRHKSYEDPLKDIEDKIGVRVVFLTSEIVYQFKDKLIESNLDLEIKTTKDFKDESFEYPQNFDYQSVHMVVQPKINDSDFPKGIIPFLTCEIQLRTLLQHAIAEVSHDTTYKGIFKNDKEILRSLSKTIALMETTDDYFIKIYTMVNDKERKHCNFLNQLIILFKQINPDYDDKLFESRINDILLVLIDKIEISISDIEAYLSKSSQNIKDLLRNDNSILSNQPIILLVAYCIENKRRQIKSNWPLSSSILKDLFIMMGHSFDDY